RVRACRYVQRRAHMLGEQLVVRQHGQIHPANAIEHIGRAKRGLAREARLSAPAGPGQRDETRLADEPGEVAQLAITADEARQMNWKVWRRLYHANVGIRGGSRKAARCKRYGTTQPSSTGRTPLAAP